MYLVKLLDRLTEIGFLEWKKSKEGGFETEIGGIGGFRLRIFEEKRITTVRGWFKEKKRKKDHWILRIHSVGFTEEITGFFSSNGNWPATYWLHCQAKKSAEEKPSLILQTKLYATILKELKLKP